MEKRTKTFLLAILVATLLVQLALLTVTFPLSRALSGAYLWHIDNPYHLYQIELGRALLKQGLLTGFDPFFAAGYMGGVTFNASARLPVIVGALLPSSISTGVIYALYVLSCAVVAPLSIIAMAKSLRWPIAHTAIAAVVGLAFWWIGALRWYHTAGLVSFVCACYLGLAYSAWAWRACKGEFSYTRLHILSIGLVGGLGIWFHPLFPVVVGAMLLATLSVQWREVRLRTFLSRALPIGAITILLNVPWLIEMAGSQNLMAQQPYLKNTGLSVMTRPLLGYWSEGAMGSFLNPISFAVLTAGIFLLPEGRRREVLPFMLAAVGLLVFAAFGASVAVLAGLQPNRFIAPAFLILGLGAAFCLAELMRRKPDGEGVRLKVLVPCFGIFFLLLISREVYREVSPGSHGRYGNPPPEVSDTPEIVRQIESWILENTTADGRILFETSLSRIHDGGHVAGALALRTEREFIGAPYPYSNPDVSFWDGKGFGKPIRDLSDQELADGLDIYNVGWIIAHSTGLIEKLGRAENVRLAAKFGEVRLFTVTRALSYVQSGAGRVEARHFNRVEVADVKGPELILRYHWVPGLKSIPPAQVEPVKVHPQFPPLVRVISPPARFTLTICPSCKNAIAADEVSQKAALVHDSGNSQARYKTTN